MFSTVRTRRVGAPRAGRPRSEREQLTELAHYTWRCSFMAPLWDLETTNVHQLKKQLRQMEQLISEDLQLLAGIRNQQLIVEVAVIDAVADADAPVPSISVTIASSAGEGGGRSDRARPVVAQLLLCSVASAPERLLPINCQQQCIWLPLQLSRGSRPLLDAVRVRLRATYGANTSDDGFDQLDMRWMAAMWLGQEGQHSEVELEYATPPPVAEAGLSSVTLTLPTDQMRDIWNSVHPEQAGPVLTRDEMERLHRVLARTATDAVGLPVEEFDLVRLQTPMGTIHADGRIHVESGEVLDQCLPFFRQLAHEFFDM